MYPGELLIIGGHEEKFNGVEILRKFAELAGKGRGAVGILPTASEIPEQVSADYIEAFKNLGIHDIKVLEVDSREKADSDQIAAMVSGLSALFITGGNQSRLTEFIAGTKLFDALKEARQRGMVLAGTSAGASIMGSDMIASAKTKENDKGLKIEMGKGFGFLENFLIDQHFSQRARFGRLLGAIAENPELVGIGIDENTAILINGSVFKVFGEHQVFVVDGKEGHLIDVIKSDNGGEELTITDFKLHTLTDGFSFDLSSRKLISRKEDSQE
ncbi:cyanophycinase [Bacillus canaveralius]|uniref:Cyanophycinase n=1 Tax=Bacillus canaveralius TaxID=1403243 RepID=A0A2N5GKR9_9BACI|nr:cyanophycinase [Bacillus canaveralius]PLR82117.1 cyanophycinase [Bacillus canaveralius]PLR97977.1 cyanophycinase [Bacillus canaveralius]